MRRVEVAGPAVEHALNDGRIAAAAWAKESVSARLRVVRRARHAMARHATALAATVTSRPVRDTLVCEVLPLLDAMRFLERRARGLLATQRVRGGRPLWLRGISAEIHREPLGVVLILGPGNYPLFLPCVQAMQALVAGNAVCLKPAPGGEAAAAAVAQWLWQAGLPEHLLQLLDASAGPAAVDRGFDRIVLTGSAETGVAVLRASATPLTPVTLELSGCDAAYIMAGADLPRVARCLSYGLTLNGGATCIAPRRVFVLESLALHVERLLVDMLVSSARDRLPMLRNQTLVHLLEQASAAGARLLQGAADLPVIVADARCDMELLQRDVLAPWLALIPVPDMATALVEDLKCPYALGASVFGPADAARRFARQIRAGSICINDLIVPTADPRLPFGGGGRSGFGRTRGAEGLMEMTAAKSVSVRRGTFLPHLAAPRPTDAVRFAKMINLLHGRW